MDTDKASALSCAPASNTFVRLAAILKNTCLGTIYQTPSGFIVSWDAGAERIFGYSHDEIVGRSGTVLVPARLNEELNEILDIVQRGSSIANWQTMRLRKDGALVQVLLSAVPVRDEQGKVSGSAITVQQMQAPVQPISELTRDFLSKMPIGVQWIGLNGSIQWANATMLRALGLDENEYRHHHISEFLIGANSSEIQDRLMAEEGIGAQQVSLKGKDGSIHHFLISSKLEWLDGSYATRVFAQEITALRNAEDRAKMALAASGVGAWEYQIETNQFICDDNMLAMLGFRAQHRTNDRGAD
jgi:PAS domain S-box-containing protein